MLEPAVRAQRAQERLLEEVVGPVAAGPPAQEREHLALVGFVEPLEGRDAAHRRMKRSRGSRCETCSSRSSDMSSGSSSRASTMCPRRGRSCTRSRRGRSPRAAVPSPPCSSRTSRGSCLLFTALADDELGRRSREELEARGVTVHAGHAPGPQRRALTHVDEDGERTITVLGDEAAPVRRGRLAAVGGARPLRRRLLRRRGRRGAACGATRRGARRHVPRAADAAACRRPGGRARRERGGRGRALRARRARARAADRRHHRRRAWRLDPPRRAVPRRAAPGAGLGRLRLRRLLRRRAHLRPRARASRSTRRSRSAPRAARRSSPAAAPYEHQLTDPGATAAGGVALDMWGWWDIVGRSGGIGRAAPCF